MIGRWNIVMTVVLVVSGIGGLPSPGRAQTTPLDESMLNAAPTVPDESYVTGLREYMSEKFDSGHIGWLLTASVAAFCLLLPGLLLFYRGLFNLPGGTRWLSDYLLLVAVMSIAWILWIYTLGFDRYVRSRDTVPAEILAPNAEKYDGNPYLGGLEHALLQGLDSQMGTAAPQFPMRRPGDKIPHMLFTYFQLMLFLIAPAPLVMALADRLRLSGLVAFVLVWGTLVYAPTAYGVWGGGWLSDNLDAAGGYALHVSVGISAIVLAVVMGRGASVPHQVAEVQLDQLAAGALLVWAGAIAVNAGSGLASNGQAAAAGFATHLAACAGVLAWTGIEWLIRGKSDRFGICAGAMSGVVAIAASNRYVGLQSAIVIGILGGGVCASLWMAVTRVGNRDPLVAVAIFHGAGGGLGVLMAGVFATSAAGGRDVVGRPISGLLIGDHERLVAQATSLFATAVIAAVGTLITLLIVRLVTWGVARADERPAATDLVKESATS